MKYLGSTCEEQPNLSALLALLMVLLSVAPILATPGWGVLQDGRDSTQNQKRRGSWSASTSVGLTLSGTWTAVADPKTGAVTGTWNLIDANGKIARRGAWSAAKSPKGWSGGWRAAVTGSKGEYAGTWSADVDLEPDASFASLFELAVKAVVNGNWRVGRQSGAWSIRASD